MVKTSYPKTREEALSEIAQRICAEPGRYLLRFPFWALPARWILSDTAMEMLNRAVAAGVSMSDAHADLKRVRNSLQRKADDSRLHVLLRDAYRDACSMLMGY